jgi:hypothetical protein
MQLWFNRDDQIQPSLQEGLHNAVVLSEGFYREICERPIPVEREVVAALAHAPGLLDFYVWITWKSWTVKGVPTHVPFFGLNGLCNQLGTKQYSVERLFRHKVRQWITQVKHFWPECTAAISEDGQPLLIRSSKISAAVRPAEKIANGKGGTSARLTEVISLRQSTSFGRHGFFEPTCSAMVFRHGRAR